MNKTVSNKYDFSDLMTSSEVIESDELNYFDKIVLVKVENAPFAIGRFYPVATKDEKNGLLGLLVNSEKKLDSRERAFVQHVLHKEYNMYIGGAFLFSGIVQFSDDAINYNPNIVVEPTPNKKFFKKIKDFKTGEMKNHYPVLFLDDPSECVTDGHFVTDFYEDQTMKDLFDAEIMDTDYLK